MNNRPARVFVIFWIYVVCLLMFAGVTSLTLEQYPIFNYVTLNDVGKIVEL